MTEQAIRFSVFTKPWNDLSIPELGQMVKQSGFDGIEFPLREGYQVNPENAKKGLPQLTEQLSDCGLQVYSVAGPLEERVFEACAEAGIPLIRTMSTLR